MTNDEVQRKFFNVDRNQYNPNLVPNPPLHSVLEVQEIINRVPTSKPQSVVDYGAGSGRISIPLLKTGFSVWSLDISEQSLKNLKTIASGLNIEKKLTTIKSFPHGKKFTVIVGADILHHIDMSVHLPKMYSALDTGGKIIFSEPGALNIAWYIYLPIFYDWNVEKGVTTCTIPNLVRRLQWAGFSHIEIIGLGLFPRSFFSFSSTLCSLNDKLGNLPILKYFAYRYLVIAEKL